MTSGVDRQLLRHGAWTSIAGHALRVGQPLLLVLATRVFGPEIYGRFVALQALAFVLARVALQGLDRALLATLPRATLRGEPSGLVPVALRILRVAFLGGAAFFGIAVASGRSIDPGLALMAVSVPCVALAELVVQVSAADGSLRVQVLLRDGLMPLLSIGGAVAASVIAPGLSGLALGHLVACSAVVVAGGAVIHRRYARDVPMRAGAPIPRRVRELARPLFANDLLETALSRADVLLLALLTSSEVVGVYAVVQQILRTLRSLRTAFEPAVIVVAARAQAEEGAAIDLPHRVREALSHASRYVALAQWSVVAVLLVAAPRVLSFFGPGFVVGARAAVIGSVLLAIAGPLAVSGAALTGLGDGRTPAVATATALVANAALLVVLVPFAGVEGAAIACGAAAIAQGLVLRLRFEDSLDRAASWAGAK